MVYSSYSALPLFNLVLIGTNIPPEFFPSCDKGAKAACAKGALNVYPMARRSHVSKFS